MARDRQVVIETVQVSKVFSDFWMRQKVKALDRVDLQVNHGEIFGMLGPNGSGKSTLVKILLGLLFPSSGRAAIFGHDPSNLLVKDRIGYMPEESYLYRYLNAEETLDFYGRLFNLPRRERRHRVQLLLEMVGLEKQKRRPIVEYSKGMARRIGLAQALVNDPDLVFLDEPTTGLDPIGTREIKDLIVELRRRGKTVFLCSHLLADVEDVCDRVAILYGGKLRRLGHVEDLLKVKAMTQVTSAHLRPETVNRIIEVIRESEGAAAEVAVDAPRERLETLFLRVVDEARSAQIESAGATAGTGAEAFFEGIAREDKTEVLLQELLKTTAQRKAEVEVREETGELAPTVLPASEPEAEAQASVLQDLVASGTPVPSRAPETSETVAEQPQVVLPASQLEQVGPTTDEVLQGLLKKPSPPEGPKPDAGSAEQKA